MNFALGLHTPQGMTRGMFFVSDVVELRRGRAVYGTSNRYVLSGAPLAKVYQKATEADLRSEFRMSSVVAIQEQPPDQQRRNPGLISPRYDHQWTASPPRPVIWHGLPNFELLDEADVEEPSYGGRFNNENAKSLLLGEDLHAILNAILYQFVHDIFFNCPDSRDNGYFNMLSSDERLNVRIAYIQDDVLPFKCAHLLVPDLEKWGTVLGSLFPGPGYHPPESAKIYRRCSYFHAWTLLLNRLPIAAALSTTNAMHTMVNDLAHWLPDATRSALWSSASQLEARWVTLPAHWEGTAPKIVVNPNKYQPHMRAEWTVRPMLRIRKEGEEADTSDSDDDFIDG